MNQTAPADWLAQVVEQINRERPEGELIVASGHSPSGVYHVGTLREIMTANAIAWALRRSGREARHLDFVDDFDAFRKVPADVPEEWKQYIGVPLVMVPDPWGDCHESYGAHRMQTLTDGLEALGCVPDETVYGYRNYQDGVLAVQLGQALDNIDEVRTILTEIGGRQLDEHWSPVQILDEQNSLRTLKYAGWDAKTRQVAWRNAAGETGSVGLDEGRVKLDWRLDWPARWAKWGVAVEPFGRDHATKGGSYDTGVALVERVFGGRPPLPVPYEFINAAGQTKKISKSSGDSLTPSDVLQVMPPEVLRYFVIHPRPGRTLTFDTGIGLYQLMEEFTAALEQPTSLALEYARAVSGAGEVVARVPFAHLVAVYQAARGDAEQVRVLLERTDYEEVAAQQWPVIERELKFVANWLEKYAPDNVKFEVQDTLPKVELSPGQKTFLAKLAKVVADEKDLNGQGMHDAVYASTEAAGIKAADGFRAVYRALLGKDFGPKAGWFLASLERDWLVKRLQDAAGRAGN